MTETTANPAIREFIEKAITENEVVLFMKGEPQQPQCGFSALVVQVLDHLGVEYAGVNVLSNEDLRNDIKVFSDWPTIPQLYVKGEFVGGADIVREMFTGGELKAFMEEKGVKLHG